MCLENNALCDPWGTETGETKNLELVLLSRLWDAEAAPLAESYSVQSELASRWLVLLYPANGDRRGINCSS